MAVYTLGHLLSLTVTPANEQERAQVDALCLQVQQTTDVMVKLACADQGYTGEQARSDAAESDIDLQVLKLPEAKKGFVMLPRRWVVERSFEWLAQFRRLSRNFERMPEVLAGLHFLVFALLKLVKAAIFLASKTSLQHRLTMARYDFFDVVRTDCHVPKNKAVFFQIRVLRLR
jgi:transposase